jgi:hypothetical protein
MTPRSLREFSVTGVVLGATSDIVATNLLLAPVAIYFYARLDQSLPAAQKSAAFIRAFTEDPQLYLVGMILGSTASIFGGWVAARVARRAELLNGALSAVACMGLGIYGMATRADVTPLWQHVAFFVLSPALGALGGVICRRQHARVQLKVPDVAALSIEAANMDLPSMEPAQTGLRGLGRILYVGNRILTGIGVLGFLIFGLVGLAGYSEHKTSLILGSAITCGLVAVVVVLLQVAARLLRAGRRTHWAYHGGALAVVSIFAALLAVGMSIKKHS